MDRLLILFLFLTLPGIETVITYSFGFPITKILVFLLLPFITKHALKVEIPYRLITILILLSVGAFYKSIHYVGDGGHRFDSVILLLWIVLASVARRSSTIRKLRLVQFLSYFTLTFLVLDGVELLNRDLIGLFDRNDEVLYKGLERFDSYLIFAQMSLLLAGLAAVMIRSNIHIRYSYGILIVSSILIFFSTSRGGIIALGFFYFCNRDLFAKRTKYTVLIIVGILICSNSVLIDVFDSGFKGIGTSSDYSSARRLLALSIGLEGFYYSPLFGQGWDFVRNSASIPPHSMPIQLLAELGLLGALIEFIVHVFVYYLLKKNSELDGIHHVYLAFVFWSFYENIGWIYGHRILALIFALGIIFIRKSANSSNVGLP